MNGCEMHWLSGSKKGREIENERRKRGIKRDGREEGKREKGGWIGGGGRERAARGGEGEEETGFYNGAAVIPVSE